MIYTCKREPESSIHRCIDVVYAELEPQVRQNSSRTLCLTRATQFFLSLYFINKIRIYVQTAHHGGIEAYWKPFEWCTPYMSFSSSFDKDPHWQLLKELISQIAQRNSLDVDVDLALGFASHYCKIGTMECLVEEGNAMAFLGPLMRAAERGCIQVVRCCIATTSCPQNVLAALSIEILKAAGERCGGSLEGVAFLLCSNFLGDPSATYAVADSIATSEDENGPLKVAIAYLPLYRECVKAGGCLFSQRLRGQLVVAARQLSGVTLEEASQGKELLAVLEHHLPSFLLNPSGVA
ncbi:hypothetical protein LIER_07692 [Lithospermum erythrorhizon]|uniref:Uncharacterized protein n=1 Tax=Lithospermum erythrorhizon TaxID=34254 RepID=A0AAV3PDE5_LITER